MWVALRGVRTTGPMAPEIDLSQQRPAQYIFSAEVQKRLSEIRKDEADAAADRKQKKASTAASAEMEKIKGLGSMNRGPFFFARLSDCHGQTAGSSESAEANSRSLPRAES